MDKKTYESGLLLLLLICKIIITFFILYMFLLVWISFHYFVLWLPGLQGFLTSAIEKHYNSLSHVSSAVVKETNRIFPFRQLLNLYLCLSVFCLLATKMHTVHVFLHSLSRIWCHSRQVLWEGSRLLDSGTKGFGGSQADLS